MPHRGLSAVALLAAGLLASPPAPAQTPDPTEAPPAVTPGIEPVAAADPKADAKSDPLTDLMKRVNTLEGELKKEKERQQAKAADAAKKPTVNWSGQIQADGVWAGQDTASRLATGDAPSGAAFRRARINMSGDYGPWEYKLGVDFALQGRPSFVDVFAALNGVPALGKVRVGHFFEPFGLEYNSQNRFLTFLERSITSEVLGAPRNFGVMASNTFADERGTWAVGVFRTDSDVFGDDSGQEFQSAVTGRVTGLAWYDAATNGRELLHVGASYSARGTKDDQVRFRARPEVRIGSTDPNLPYLVDTGAIRADFYQLMNAEVMWVHGPLSVQGEYQLMPVSTLNRGAVYFSAWYVYASVFLTGENRAYRKSAGVLDRIAPRRDFVKKDGGGVVWGPGAWELAFRVSHLDLTDGGVNGGRLTDLTFGVNWYLSPYTRITLNYIKAFQSPPGQKPGGTADVVGLRAGYEF